MRRRELILGSAALLLAPGLARTQPAGRVARVGYLSLGTPASGVANLKALNEGLAALGWREGQNLAIEARYASNSASALAALAAELVALKPDVIVSLGPGASMALKNLGSDIPVVFVVVADPLGLGLAQSLARPGGNFTGLATVAPEFMLGKQVELLREIVPRASRIAYVYNPENPVHIKGRELRLRVAKEQNLEPIEVPAKVREDYALAFAEAARRKADVMYLGGDPLALVNREHIAELALQHRLPVMFLFYQHVEAGGLVSYGTDIVDINRRGAAYVDKILRGASPRDLPIEEPAKYLLVINQRTARALGLALPQSLLLRADRVVE